MAILLDRVRNPHPAVAVLALRRVTRREIARRLGFSEHYVGRALNGYERPSPRLRRGLADMLDMPQRELFHGEEP